METLTDIWIDLNVGYVEHDCDAEEGCGVSFVPEFRSRLHMVKLEGLNSEKLADMKREILHQVSLHIDRVKEDMERKEKHGVDIQKPYYGEGQEPPKEETEGDTK